MAPRNGLSTQLPAFLLLFRLELFFNRELLSVTMPATYFLAARIQTTSFPRLPSAVRPLPSSPYFLALIAARPHSRRLLGIQIQSASLIRTITPLTKIRRRYAWITPSAQ